MKTLLSSLLITGLLLSGCANLSSVHRTLDTTNGQGVLIDIKQRAILASKISDKDSGPLVTHPVVCAEPSPDALSAYAFDLAAQGNLPAGKALSASIGSAESSAFVGLRTQSIQLLRDQFFRACEAYMNKAINSAEYSMLIRRYQKQTAALLAIEQLTSVVSAPAAIVSAAGTAKGSTSSFLQGVFEDNKDKIAALQKDMTTTGVTDDQKKADQAEIDRLKKQNDGIVESLKSVGSDSVSTATSGNTSGNTTDPKAGNNSQESTISSVVQHIVDSITLTDDFLQLCIVNFSTSATSEVTSLANMAAPSGRADPRDMREACMRRMGIANESVQIQNDAKRNYLASILNDPTLAPAEKRKALGEFVSDKENPTAEDKYYRYATPLGAGTTTIRQPFEIRGFDFSSLDSPRKKPKKTGNNAQKGKKSK